MRAEVKYYHCADANLELFDFNLNCGFVLHIEINIGVIGADASDIFSLSVVSTPWLIEKMESSGEEAWLRNALITNARSWKEISFIIESKVRALQGDDWRDLALKINQFAKWEFADYRV